LSFPFHFSPSGREIGDKLALARRVIQDGGFPIRDFP